MKFLVKVTLQNGASRLVNEEQVVQIEPSPEGYAILHLSNGEILTVTNPPYHLWENDLYSRKDWNDQGTQGTLQNLPQHFDFSLSE